MQNRTWFSPNRVVGYRQTCTADQRQSSVQTAVYLEVKKSVLTMVFTGYASEVWLVHQLPSIGFEAVSNRWLMFSDDDSLRTFTILTAD